MKLRPDGPFPSHDGTQLPEEMQALPPGNLLLPYQQEFHKARALPGLLFVEKSRRIGLTWGMAATCVLRAAKSRADGGRSQLYISYAFDMTKEFIDACAMWAKAFGQAAGDASEFLFEDQDEYGETKHIKAFSIDFASGFQIRALSSAPRSLRGKQGDVIIDEAAFVTDLDALLDAAIALTIWGGDVTVISTHYGIENTFNKVIQDIRGENRLGRVMRITFDNALAAGLYERICLVSRQEATPEGKAAFRARTYGMYGAGASQELDVVPSKGGGAWLSYDQIERAEDPSAVVARLAMEDAFVFKPDHIREAEIRDWCEAVLWPVIQRFAASDCFGFGWDFARSGDLSVFWLMQELQDRTWVTPLVVELRNMPFREQELVAKYILDRLRRWRAAGDANGNGQYLAERLVQKFGEDRVAAIRTNEGWWREHGPPIKSRFEDGRIKIPRDKDIAADHQAVRLVNGVASIPQSRNTAKGEDASAAGGKTKRHADSAVASVMSGYALRQGVGEPIEFQSSGSSLPAVSRDVDFDRGFGAIPSELQVQGF